MRLIAFMLICPLIASAEGTLTLDQAWDAALSDSHDLVIQRATVDRASAGKRQALAAMLPVLSASATYRLNDEEVKLGDSVVKRQHDIFGSMRLSMGLFDARALPSLSIAGQRVDQATLQLRSLREQIILDVAVAYYSALTAEQLEGIAQRAVDARKRHLAVAETRLHARVGVILDVERARAELHRAEGDLIEATAQVAATRDGLAIAIGRAPPLAVTLTRPESHQPSTLLADEAATRARTHRLDLQVLRAQTRIMDDAEFVTWMAFVPTLSLVGNLDFSQASFNKTKEVTPSLSITLGWTLYDGGYRYAQLREDAANIREARARLAQRELAVVADVRGAIRAIQTAKASLTASDAEKAAATRALKAAEESFRLGRANTLDVVDAQLAAERAEVSGLRERLSLDVARLRLSRALGESMFPARKRHRD